MKPVFAIQIRREINLKQPWLTLWEWKKISWNLWKSSSTSLKKSNTDLWWLTIRITSKNINS